MDETPNGRNPQKTKSPIMENGTKPPKDEIPKKGKWDEIPKGEDTPKPPMDEIPKHPKCPEIPKILFINKNRIEYSQMMGQSILLVKLHPNLAKSSF